MQASTFYKKEDVNRESPVTRIYYNISSMVQLNNVAEELKEIHLTLPVESLTDEFVEELVETVKHSRGKSTFRLTLVEPKEGVTVSLHAKKRKVRLSEQMCEFIKKHGIEYSFG